MFEKVLIANRGEIAVRIIRACRELGLETVSVYSQADADALHVRLADRAVCIGPPAASQSYLHIPAIIAAAEISGADAIHPGYGFLAENGQFAELCGKAGLTFIGPPAAMLHLMGDKVKARQAMAKADLPLLPGSSVVSSEEELEAVGDQIGYPLIIKACAGGGGRGMKLVRDYGDLMSAWVTARTEAKAAFGNADVYLERFVERPRHIEVQVAADRHGNARHLGERECSIQRRHQKLIEEAPSTVLSEKERHRLGKAAVKAISAIGYDNVGTIEFLMDEDGRCYFMEMNTRIQVEHTVTEMVTGIDLLAEQIRLAAGERISFRQEDVQIDGHAIEVRINAEDPRTYAPSPGRVTAVHLPGGLGVRVDTALYAGVIVPPHYDSLIAKLVVHAPTRARAIERMLGALTEFVVEGIKCNASLYTEILQSEDFCKGDISTAFLDRFERERPAA